jgi:hypothetical protein
MSRQDDSPHVSAELRREGGLLASHPPREVGRLKQEAEIGESAATPVILVAGMVILAVALVAIVIATVLVAATLLTR